MRNVWIFDSKQAPNLITPLKRAKRDNDHWSVDGVSSVEGRDSYDASFEPLILQRERERETFWAY